MRRALVLLSLVVVGIGAAAWLGNSYLRQPVGGTARATVQVDRGKTLRPVLKELAAQGVLRHPNWLYLYARLLKSTNVRAGAYEARADQSPREILAMLLEGRVKLETFTVAEGLNRWQIRSLLVEAQWMTAQQFDALCDDPAFLAENKVPGPTCEGYLFPETYKLARGVKPRTLLQTMLAAYRRQVAAATVDGWGPLSLSEREFTTLASIVEKETGAPQERPRIACVFYNRLRARPAWRLETDPTVIYAASLKDPKFNGNITRSHLRELDSPYNTYRVFGLPPGPIANPGRAALEAVAKPASCADFFFVSTNNGQHVFCPTLDCHNQAVQKWQVDYFRQQRRQRL